MMTINIKIQDDVIRFPVDVFSFTDMEEKWPHFKEESRNLRISLDEDMD